MCVCVCVCVHACIVQQYSPQHKPVFLGDGVSDFIDVTNDAVGDHCGAEWTTCRFTEVGEEEEGCRKR